LMVQQSRALLNHSMELITRSDALVNQHVSGGELVAAASALAATPCKVRP
jgi:hypothetical protein